MNNFYYYNHTKIQFGDDALSKLGELSKAYKKILVHYGSDRIKKNGLFDEAVKQLKENGAEIIELGGVEPNPTLELAHKGIEICKTEGIDFILTLGGGSVIDSAKAIAMGAKIDGEVWDIFMRKTEMKEALPIGVVLTIPATGSETSPATVITNEKIKSKRSMGNDLLRPEFAILDPTMTMTLPKNQTFAGIVDMLTHVFERYFTKTKNVMITDEMCEGVIRTIMKNAYILLENPNDYSARSEIMLGGTIAHSGILGIGREEDWGTHRIAHEITALYGTTHGRTLAIIAPHWMDYVYKKHIDRFAQFARKIFDVTGEDDEAVAKEGIARYVKFLKDIGEPTSFTEANLPTDEIELMADKAVIFGPLGFLEKLEKEDIINIYNLAK